MSTVIETATRKDKAKGARKGAKDSSAKRSSQKASDPRQITIKPDEESPLVNELTVVLSMTIAAVAFKKKVKSKDVIDDETIDHTMIHVSKDLIDSKELKELRSEKTRFRNWLIARSLPTKMLKGGMFLLPSGSVEEVDREIILFRDRRAKAFTRFAARYPQMIEDAKKSLGSQFEASDYPSIESLSAAFDIEWEYISYNVEEKLDKISAAIYERERAKAQVKWRARTEEVIDALRVELANYLAYMTDRLSFDDGGKPKVFKESGIKKFEEFLTLFESRNVLNDQEISKLVGKAKSLLKGVDAQKLRKEDGYRMSVRASFEELKKKVDPMIVTRERKIVFDRDV